jgi:hypothetical protein
MDELDCLYVLNIKLKFNCLYIEYDANNIL